MDLKNIKFKKLVNVQNGIILVILLTILYYIFNPHDFFQNYRSFETQYRQLKSANFFFFNPLKQNEVFIAKQLNRDPYLTILFYNIETNALMQRDINKAFIIDNHNPISSLYFDESENTVLIPIVKNKYDISILTASFVNRDISIKKILSLKNLYESLIDTVIVKNGIKFFHSVLASDKSCIEEYKDGFRFCLCRSLVDSLFKSLSNYSAYKLLEDNIAYSKLSLMLNDELGDITYFDNYDVYEIIHFFNRNNFYQEKYFKESNFKLLPILEMEIVANEDLNNDGNKELIIVVRFDRFLDAYIICYDMKAENILWIRNDYKDPRDFLILDINNDGINEILFSTYAPCNEPQVDYNETTNFNNQSYFVILNANGSLYNNKPYVFTTISGFYEYRFAKIENSDKLLFGMKSNYDSSEKPFFVYDYTTQKIDTLNITYQNITSYEKKDGHIIFYDANDEGMRILEFDGSLSVIKDKKYDSGFPIFKGCSDNKITIYDESFYMSANDPKRIVNRFFEVIYEFPNPIIIYRK